MIVIVWVNRGGLINIGEQKVYSDCLGVEDIVKEEKKFKRITHLFNKLIKEDYWPAEQVIKIEII